MLSLQSGEDWLAKGFFPTARHAGLLWLTSTRGPSLLGSLLVAALVEHKSWKARMCLGRDPREAKFRSFSVGAHHGCWLCVHRDNYYTSFAASRESVIIWSCPIIINPFCLSCLRVWFGIRLFLVAVLLGNDCGNEIFRLRSKYSSWSEHAYILCKRTKWWNTSKTQTRVLELYRENSKIAILC